MKSKESGRSSVCFIALGSNLSEPEKQLRMAISSLKDLGVLLEQSDLYRSPALIGGPKGQDDYVNAVVKIQSDLSPRDLLLALKAIEKQQGRVKVERWGPRIIDLDIISYDQLVLEEGDLSIPHKEVLNRPFVLQPLLDISPDWEDPITGTSAKEALDKLRPFQLVRLKSV